MKLIPFLLTIILVSASVLRSYSQDADFVGYATALIEGNSIAKIDYVGYSDKEKALKYDESTIQPIGSVSKTFIGLSIMIAQEKGLLDLDDDIRKYLDFEFENPYIKFENKITLRHLVSHTSGIVDNEKIYESSYAIGLEPSMELGPFLKEYLTKGGSKYSKNNFSKSIAGTRYEYSNIASGLAAYIVEIASGKPFDLFTKEYIFKPLKMNNTGWFYKDIDKANHAILYDEKDKALEPYSCILYPDGSLKTTISDLSLYLIELIEGFNNESNLISEKSWEEFFKPNFTAEMEVKNINKKEPNTGVFIAYFKSGNIGHTGSDLGVSTIMLFDPRSNTGKIFMSNEDLTAKNVEKFKMIWGAID